MILLKLKKDIPRPIFILKLANRKVYKKNQNISYLSYIEKKAIILSKMFGLKPLIFWARTSIC